MFENVFILLSYLSAKRLLSLSSREELEGHQARQLHQFRAKVLPKFPYYQRYLNKDWLDFPIMDKLSMTENFKDLNRLRFDHGSALAIAQDAVGKNSSAQVNGVTFGMSTGTSGQRGLFLVDKSERIKWLGTILAKALPGPISEKHKVALFLSANSDLYKTTSHSRRMQFKFFDLSSDIRKFVKGIDEFDPTIVIAPAQVLRLLAEEQRSGAINIKPRKIFSCAEVLDSNDATEIKRAWSIPVHQIYQCTEGFLGITCSEGTIHLNEEYVLFEKEWIDKETGRFNPVITDFSRHTQAMVRYRMNDVLIERKSPCPCGSPLTAIERIEGRMDDIVWLKSSTEDDIKVPLFPDHLRATILDVKPSISDFRAFQTDVNKLQISLFGTDTALERHNVSKAIKKELLGLGAEPMDIDFTKWINEPSLNTKLRRIIAYQQRSPLSLATNPHHSMRAK